MKLIPEVQKIVSGYYSLCQDYASTEANGRLDDMALAIQNAVAAKCVEIAMQKAEQYSSVVDLQANAAWSATGAQRCADVIRSHFQLPEK